MKIFSINYGHDASVCVFEDGTLIDFVEIERESRLKHHFGINTAFLIQYLDRVGMKFTDVDMVILSGTQQWGLYHDERVSSKFGYFEQLHQPLGILPLQHWDHGNYRFFDGYAESIFKEHVESQNLVADASPLRTKWGHKFCTNFSGIPHTLSAITRGAIQLSDSELKNYWSYFLAPYNFSLDGVEKPAFYIEHHFAHANYSLFYSDQLALSVTHDGGVNASAFNSGGIYVLDPSRGVIPLMSHGLTLGNIYDSVARVFNIDAGKLMGLASYGRPNRFINAVAETYVNNLYHGTTLPAQSITQMILGASSMSYKLREEGLNKFEFDFPNKELAVQAAANAQYLVQKVYVELVSSACEDIKSVLPDLRNVYTTGGFSLNCPTNAELNYSNNVLHFIPLPGVGDTGLAIGGAVAASQYFGVKVSQSHLENRMAAAYPPSKLKSLGDRNHVQNLLKLEIEDLGLFMAENMMAGAIICVHRGRSEVGPRALGNRSILAWAGREEIRDKINALKGREPWRPLAPMVKAEDFSEYFHGEPGDCRFMLTVSKVKQSSIPAVTHIDNTARVQVIEEDDLLLTSVLTHLRELGGDPVIVNTSFNCAGEPLVESFADACRSFTSMGFDFLVSEGEVFCRNNP